jgi:Plasmid pRiA4b ORF-3-like protein
MGQLNVHPIIYQLRITLRGISPLIWRRLLVCNETTLTQLHAMLQILFAWNDEPLYSFHVHGREDGSNGAPPTYIRISALHLHRGERFRYVYDFMAHWACDIRLEALLPLAPRRAYPVCMWGKRAAPPEECRGAWAYMERLDRHRLYPPIEVMGVVADAISTLLGADPQTSVRQVLGDLDDLREAVDRLEAYQAFQPDACDRRYINTQLQSRAWPGGATR